MLIKIDVNLYGSISSYYGGKHIAQITLDMPSGVTKGELLAHLGIPDAERGYLFINAVLFDVPGLITDNHTYLKDGDHVGIFSADRVWPYQYRDGINMSPGLQKALKIHGAMHHSYQNT